MTRILIVDDDEQTRSVLRRRLGSAGYHVLEARDAEGALALCRDALPDVVLTDLRLPGRSGEEFIAQLRQSHGGVPVIAISGAPERLAALRGGPIHTLPKPFTTHALNQALASAFSLPPAAAPAPGPEPSLLRRLGKFLGL